MYCSKCKYTSFDHLDKCPKCGQNWSETKKALNLEWLGYNEKPWIDEARADFGFEKNDEPQLISGYDESEDMEFTFDENSGQNEDNEVEIEELAETSTDDGIIDYFQEDTEESGEPVLEFELEENKSGPREKEPENLEDEIDISQLEWEEDELGATAPEAPEKQSELSGQDDNLQNKEKNEVVGLQDVDLEEIDISEPEQEPATEKQATEDLGGEDDLDDLDLNFDDDEANSTDDFDENNNTQTPGSQAEEDEDIAINLTLDDFDEDILDEAGLQSENSEHKKTNTANGEDAQIELEELDGDIDYPELDLEKK
ncbi:MAG: hypothetical protein ACQES5_11220 [Thermodesulfobacteriota bacterium]